MDEYLSKQEIMQKIETAYAPGITLVDPCTFIELIDDILPANVVPKITAQWVPAPDLGDCIYRCNSCGHAYDAYYESEPHYCSECGSMMTAE